MTYAEAFVVLLCLYVLGAAGLDLYHYLTRRARNQRRQRAALMRDFLSTTKRN